MRELITSTPTLLLLTLGTYLLSIWLRKKTKISLIHPFLICIPVIIAYLKITDVEYKQYYEANKYIDFLLAPSVVSLGLLLYDQLETIKKNWISILTSILTGSIVGVVSVYILCGIFNLDAVFTHSLEPKSVTTPIAMDISASLGGNVSLTICTVVVCGFLGAIFGPAMLKIFGIKDPLARGLAMGCCAHGLGTAKAIEMGAIEGAVSGLSIAIMGVFTAIIAPLFNLFFS